jgi:hypothetical protein
MGKGQSAADDDAILALWRGGANLDDIAAACGTSVVRAAHDVNRVLNKQTVGMDFSKLRTPMERNPETGGSK